MRKYTIVDYFGYNISPKERMNAIKAAGFDGVILLWAEYFDEDFNRFPDYAAEAGLYVENAHAPYRGANALWYDNLRGADYTERLIACITDCVFYGIPTLVMHPTSKGDIPLPCDGVGLDRMKRIAEAAERFDVNVALENMGSPDYIGYIFDNVKSKRLGFCYDSGHHLCFTPERDLLSEYGDRLMALHLHDNDGAADSHNLPLTGKVNWTKLSQKLEALGYGGACALEAQNGGFEDITDPVEFLRIALSKAKAVL